MGLLSLYRVSGKLGENTDIGINRENYRMGYSLFGFDVDPTSSADFSYIGKPKNGRTRIDMKFRKPLPNSVTVIIYATFPEVMNIDESRLISLEQRDRRSRIGGVAGG